MFSSRFLGGTSRGEINGNGLWAQQQGAAAYGVGKKKWLRRQRQYVAAKLVPHSSAHERKIITLLVVPVHAASVGNIR